MSQGLSDIASDHAIGGPSDERAAHHLDTMNKLDVALPWHLSISCGCALRAARLKAWGGNAENLAAAPAGFFERAKANGAATLNAYA